MNKILYLTGMHSSGTSLTSNYLQHCGVHMMGNAPTDFLCEDKQFRRTSHKILRDSNIHRYAKEEFDHTKINPSKTTCTLMSNTIINYVGLMRRKNWGWKAPINSLCIWSWLPMLKSITNGSHEVCIVLIFRHPTEVIQSFYRRKSNKDLNFIGSLSKEPYSNIESIWYNYNKSVLDFYKQSEGFNLIVVRTKDLIENPTVLTKALDLEQADFSVIFNKKRFKEEKKLIFRLEKSKPLWDELMDLRIR